MVEIFEFKIMRIFLIFGIFSIVIMFFLVLNLDVLDILYLLLKFLLEFIKINIIYIVNNWYNYKVEDGSYIVYFFV